MEVNTRARRADGFEVTLADGRRVKCRKAAHRHRHDGYPARDSRVRAVLRSHRFSMPVLRRLGNARQGARRVRPSAARIRDGARTHRVDRRHRAAHRWKQPLHGRRAAAPRAQRHSAHRKAHRSARRPRADRLRAVRFRDGEILAREGLFFDTPSRSQSTLADSLGCRYGRHGGILCGQYEATSVPACSLRATSSAMSSYPSSPQRRARAPHSESIAHSRAKMFERRATGTRRIEHPAPSDNVSRGATTKQRSRL